MKKKIYSVLPIFGISLSFSLFPANAASTYLEPSIKSSPIENCKIKEVSDQGNAGGGLASGFPFMDRFASYPKEMKMALIPIDFNDLPGDSKIEQRVQTQMNTLSEWYKLVSGGKFTVTWQLNKSWVRLPGSSSDYKVPYSGAYPETSKFWEKVLPVVDSKIDLSGIQTINFLLPSKQKIIKESVQSFPFLTEMQTINSSQTKLISFAVAGNYFDTPNKNYWSYWAHEFGHVLGLAHIGSSRGSSQTYNSLDLMGNQDGPYRELSGWMRFIIGWLDDSQVYCQDISNGSENKISLVPLGTSANGIKLVVIPSEKNGAIIIESRRPTKFSCSNAKLPSGVLVYKYDAKLGNQSYFLSAKYPTKRAKNIKCPGNSNMENYPDALLHNGQSITVDNYQISVTSTGKFDQISIKKKL